MTHLIIIIIIIIVVVVVVVVVLSIKDANDSCCLVLLKFLALVVHLWLSGGHG